LSDTAQAAQNPEKAEGGFMVKVAAAIVDRRNLIFLITIILIIFSVVSRSWVEVENNLTAYLPSDSETRQALDIMDEEFTTFGSANVMVQNVTLAEAEVLERVLTEIEGVQSVNFDDTTDHYNNVSALYSITFDAPEDDDACLEALDRVKAALADYDIYVSTSLGNPTGDIIDKEVSMIFVYVAIIIVTVLLLTSSTYGEIPVLLLTFVIAMIVNQGTNFLLGKISFVSNSVTSILQLALSLDYAIIFCNRFKEEHEHLSVRDAAIVALSKAIPEIGASSLTTIGGLVAMMFMQFKLGPDMAICLIKSIAFALISVFVVMPGLLVLFGPLIDKTAHKSFIPKIDFIGKFDYLTRFIIPPIFLVLIFFAMRFSNQCPYAYGYDGLTTPKLNYVQIANNTIAENFTSSNMVALIVPGHDYETEAKVLSELEKYDEVDSTQGLANIEAMAGYTLTDGLTPRNFAELAGIDYEIAQVVYSAYAVSEEEYGRIISGLSNYEVPLIDIFTFVYEKVEEGYVTLDANTVKTLESAYTQMSNGRKQLQGENYDRMLIYLNLPQADDETYAFLDTIRSVAERYYGEGNVYVAGNSTSAYDFKKSFSTDNTVVSVLTLLIVLAVLLFTFMSVGMPLLLILVIQGSIWINFAFPYLTGNSIFFLSYLVVSSIQMGANIDYAIVIGSRYMEFKDKMNHREAIIETLNFAFPTIITSGTILATAGILIGQLTSECAICGIGQALGRGTIISIILVMFVLPQILLIGAGIIEATSFSVPKRTAGRSLAASGRTFVDGQISGTVNGQVQGIFKGYIDGDVDVHLTGGGKSGQEASGEASKTSSGKEGEA